MSNHKTQKPSLFRRWLAIQICFMALMIAASIALFFYTNAQIKRQVDALHMSGLQKTQTQTEALFSSARATVDEYVLNPQLRVLASRGAAPGDRAYAKLVDDIKQTNAVAPGVQEVVVCFLGPGLFVSSAGVMDAQIFADVYADATGCGIAAQMMRSEDWEQLVPVQCARSGAPVDTCLYARPIGRNAVVAAVVDRAQVQRTLLSGADGALGAFQICTEDGGTLFATGGAAECGEPVSADRPEKVTISGDEYYALSSGSSGMDLVFTRYIASENYFERFSAIQLTAVLILAAATVLGVAASYLITRHHYAPVKRAVGAARAVTPQDIYSSSEDELKQIVRAVEFVHSQEKQSKQALLEHSEYILSSAVKKILDGELQYKDTSEYVKKLIGIRPGRVYTAAVLEEDVPDTPVRTLEKLRSYAEKTAGVRHAISKGGRVVWIFETRAADAVQRLNGAAFLAQVNMTAAVGKEGRGFAGLRQSYQDALRQLGRKIIPGTGRLIAPETARESKAIAISEQDDMRLCSLIQAGEAQQADELLARLVSTKEDAAPDVFSYKAYLYSISGAIIRAAESVRDEALIRETLRAFGEAFESDAFERIVQTLKESAARVAGLCRRRTQNAGDVLNARIVQYIESRINDAQLSAESIAGEMAMNAAYLRRIFKENNGISLWDFINMKRIETARGLLITTTMSIKAVAQRCGYVSISTFVRTFKKFAAMTPGHYRNLYR